jgi:hypothetical protein
MPINKHRTAVIASAVGLSLGGGAIASAASRSGSSTTPSTTTQAAPPAHPDEQALTRDTAAKVKAAALAKVPGATVLRVETDAGGVYEAHVRQADGTEAEVHVDKDDNVTSVDTRPAGGGRGGPGGHGGGHGPVDTAALAKALGVTEAKLQAALAKVEPAQGDRAAHEAQETAAIAKALGQPAADVQAVVDANRPDRSAGKGPGHDDAALAKALAAKFGITQDKAQAALDAAHPDKGERGIELATALAKALGLDAAKVKAALDAQHPGRP